VLRRRRRQRFQCLLRLCRLVNVVIRLCRLLSEPSCQCFPRFRHLVNVFSGSAVFPASHLSFQGLLRLCRLLSEPFIFAMSSQALPSSQRAPSLPSLRMSPPTLLPTLRMSPPTLLASRRLAHITTQPQTAGPRPDLVVGEDFHIEPSHNIGEPNQLAVARQPTAYGISVSAIIKFRLRDNLVKGVCNNLVNGAKPKER
jgi:hypothetical protein